MNYSHSLALLTSLFSFSCAALAPLPIDLQDAFIFAQQHNTNFFIDTNLQQEIAIALRDIKRNYPELCEYHPIQHHCFDKILLKLDNKHTKLATKGNYLKNSTIEHNGQQISITKVKHHNRLFFFSTNYFTLSLSENVNVPGVLAAYAQQLGVKQALYKRKPYTQPYKTIELEITEKELRFLFKTYTTRKKYIRNYDREEVPYFDKKTGLWNYKLVTVSDEDTDYITILEVKDMLCIVYERTT